MQLRGLRTAQFRVDDVAAVRDWYEQLLGTAPYYDEPYYVGFEVGGYEFGVYPGEGTDQKPLFLWATEDPQGFIEYAVSLGASPGVDAEDTGGGIVVGTFVDPFGNEFGVIRNPDFAAPLTYAAADDVAPATITYEAEVTATPTEAWNLWATEEGLGQWWTENTRVDLRPGGHYEIHFNPDERPGDRGGDWCRVLSFLPGRMISFTWNAPPTLKTRPLHTWVVVLFEEAGTGCKVSLNHHGWPQSGLDDPDSDWPATFEYFERAWQYVMKLFSDYFGDE